MPFNLSEDQRLLMKLIDEFSESEVAPVALRIEREGAGPDIIGKLAQQGFMGALAPVEMGGAGLDAVGYAILLEQLAKRSPSLAFYVLIQNSFVISPVMRMGSDGLKEDVVPSVASGKASGTLVAEDVLRNAPGSPLAVEGGRVVGRKDYVINSGAELFLAPVSMDGAIAMAAIRGGARRVSENRRLGLRGLPYSAVEFNSELSEGDILAKEKGMEAMESVLDDAALAVAALALGMAEAAIQRSIEYAGSRRAFGALLKEFQPLAFGAGEYWAELQALKSYVLELAGAGPSSKPEEILGAKALSVEFAKRASRFGIQMHGGYGYLEDLGLEKFYRDSMALEVLTGNPLKEKTKLARMVLGEDAARI